MKRLSKVLLEATLMEERNTSLGCSKNGEKSSYKRQKHLTMELKIIFKNEEYIQVVHATFFNLREYLPIQNLH